MCAVSQVNQVNERDGTMEEDWEAIAGEAERSDPRIEADPDTDDRPQESLKVPATAANLAALDGETLHFELPDPEDDQLGDPDFQQQVDQAWHVCDRFDLQTEIWRGRILRVVRDRQKRGGDHRGAGFLRWLQERDITKSRAYALIELANSADELLSHGHLDPSTLNQFSKRAFMETAQSSPEVQQLVTDAARDGQRITRHNVKQLADEWTAVTSDLLPEAVREKAMDHSLPVRYVAPLVKEMAKLPPSHQIALQDEVAANPDVETVKQSTATARYLARYLDAATQVHTLANVTVNLEDALEEALRLDCLTIAADVVNQAAQVEQSLAKFHSSWKRLGSLSERLYLESGSSTPHLRSLLQALQCLSGDTITLNLGEGSTSHQLRIQVLPEEETANPRDSGVEADPSDVQPAPSAQDAKDAHLDSDLDADPDDDPPPW